MEETLRLSPAEYRRVLAFMEKALDEEPGRWSYWCDIGFCQGQLGRWGEAAVALERIAGKAEATPRALGLLGHAYLMLERYHESEAILKRAHALAPDNLNILYTMAVVQFHRGEIASALAPLQEVIRQAPRHAKAQFSIGLIHHRLGERDAAMGQIAIVGELDPTLADRLASLLQEG